MRNSRGKNSHNMQQILLLLMLYFLNFTNGQPICSNKSVLGKLQFSMNISSTENITSLENYDENYNNCTQPNDLSPIDPGKNENYNTDYAINLDLSEEVDLYINEYGNSYNCMLDELKDKYLWWVYLNGTLTPQANKSDVAIDFSFQRLNNDALLYWSLKKYYSAINKFQTAIEIFSIAHNNLTAIPYDTLSDQRIKTNLRVLSLNGNNISKEFDYYLMNERRGFPLLINLVDLDLRNCYITMLPGFSFQMMPNLRRLYLARNMIKTIYKEAFSNLNNIYYIDLSKNYNNLAVTDYEKQLYLSVNNDFVTIYNAAFQNLRNLTILDLSETKLSTYSIFSLTNLPKTMKLLSICRTSLALLTPGQFNKTQLVGLDISGNTGLAETVVGNWFSGITKSLKYLHFSNANVKNLTFLSNLKSLEVLKLSNNIIPGVIRNIFPNLPELRVLDLRNNHLTNWYTQIFTNNTALRILDLRSNNLNAITPEMLSDFSTLNYVGLSRNSFVCSCLISTLIDVSAYNYTPIDYMLKTLPDDKKFQVANPYEFPVGLLKHNIIFSQLVLTEYVYDLRISQQNLNRLFKNTTHMRFKVTEIPANLNEYGNANHLKTANLHLQLFDYSNANYFCYNDSNLIQFHSLNCRQQKSISNYQRAQSHINLEIIFGSTVGIILLFLTIGSLAYWKRWHIHYYYVALKSATLWSLQAKMASDQFISLDEEEPYHLYDIFISYCQRDRDWVLDELLPNIEQTDQVTLCLHERDFEIGETIMDNIVSSMDRSRAMMLIISQNSLLSHWCQFEMYLAQHRTIEASKEHLLLVLLEDIPRSKRPKPLQYLMNVKTYIKWPRNNTDEQKIFWHRLKRSLQQIGLFEQLSSR